MATINEMRQVATQIENETQVGGNTASRVGGLFGDVVDHLGDTENDVETLNETTPRISNTSALTNLDVADEYNNVLARFSGGHVQTKNFNSATDAPTKSTDTNKGDFEISDENNYVLLRLKDGHIKTMLFDSSSIKLENLSEDLNLLINEVIHQGIPNSLAIVFKKVCCIGDSLTAGFTRIGSVDIGSAAARQLKNNWPGYMEKLTGNEYVNLAIGSSTAHHWRYEDGPYSDYKPDFDLANDTTFDAYIVALGVNDERNNLTVGTTSDIATDKSLNADTFCGNYDYIVRQLMEWNEKAHIFCLTIPLSEGNKVVPYNAIISEIGNLYPNKVHVLSLEGDDVDLSWIAANFSNGHYCPIVYNYFASVIFKRISAFVKNNNILVRETPYK